MTEEQKELYEIVRQQAEDESLWSVPVRGMQQIGEAYLQQELRRLHEVIERYRAKGVIVEEKELLQRELINELSKQAQNGTFRAERHDAGHFRDWTGPTISLDDAIETVNKVLETE